MDTFTRGLLPPRPTRLIGRDRELAALLNLLGRDDVRLLTITGPPGVGKTRLALEAASEVQSEFPDATAFVDLAPIRDAGLLPYAVAQQLDVHEESEGGGDTLASLLVEYLSKKRLLLLLDNFEQIVAAAPLVGEWLGAASGLKILVTSRVPLQLQWEQDFPLDPLPFEEPSGRVSSVPPPAVVLFVERARAVNPQFALDAETVSLVSAICARLDGLPLAIELAAARLRHLPLPDLHKHLEHRLDLLTSGRRDLPLRQQTLRQAIGWSYDLLEAQEQVLFRRAAVFAGGFSLEGLSEVCAPDLTATLLDGVASLVNKHLVRQVPTGPEARFQILESLREFGLEQLEAAVETAEVQHRHFEFFSRLANGAAEVLSGAEQLTWLHRLDGDIDNIRSALSWALQDCVEACLKLAAALREFWDIRGYFTEGRDWIERALSAGRDLPPALRARALVVAGQLAYQQGDPQAARGMFEESLSLARGLGDQILVADATLHLGSLTSAEGNHQVSGQLMEEALATYKTVEGAPIPVRAYFVLGWNAGYQGRSDEAEAMYREGYRLSRQAGNRYHMQMALNGLGIAAFSRDNYEATRRLWTERLAPQENSKPRD